eukprot:6547179-Pyramimonas_sp.AAC.1
MIYSKSKYQARTPEKVRVRSLTSVLASYCAKDLQNPKTLLPPHTHGRAPTSLTHQVTHVHHRHITGVKSVGGTRVPAKSDPIVAVNPELPPQNPKPGKPTAQNRSREARAPRSEYTVQLTQSSDRRSKT